MTARQEKRDVRAAHSDPINFTCGICGKVHKFDPEHPLECPDRKEDE